MRTLRTVNRSSGQTHQSSRWRSGQGLSEYALLLTLVAAVAVGGLGLLGSSTSDQVRGVSVSMGAEAEGSGTSVHVDGINLRVQATHARARVRAIVTVRDQNGASVSGVTVSANWYVNGVLVESDADATDGQGRARLTYQADADDVEEGDVVRLTVTDVSTSGYEYASASNAETAAQIVVP